MARQLGSLEYRPKTGLCGAARPGGRRGVASVLAMMFLVIFGSLAVAMAVVAQGNLRTADSSLKVSRAMSAAETGLVFAANRMAQESNRFIVREGLITYPFGDALWRGAVDPADVDVLPPVGYPAPPTPPAGIIQGIRDAHLADDHARNIEPGDESLPDLNDVDGILVCKPIPLEDVEGAPYFRIRYEMLDDNGNPDVALVRVVSEGIDGAITRTLSMDFRIEKKIEFAVLATNRIMIGKNVLVEGPLGSRYGIDPATGLPNPQELGTDNGDPLVLRSDFYFLDDTLSTNLDTFFAQVIANDVDGDCRLRPDHPTEGAGLGGIPELVDYDGDEFIDDFDLFLAQFDADADGAVCYDAVLADDAERPGLTDEFDDGDGNVIDFQLARLIDESRPDRDGDGFDETLSDRRLGFRDGVLDVNDVYAKVSGRLAFAVAQADWETANGAQSYQTVVQGPIRPGIDEAAVIFEVPAQEALEITTDMFVGSQGWFEAQVPVEDPGPPPLDPALLVNEAIAGGVPANYTAPADSDWEAVPFGSTGAYDHYQRPIYQDMTFENVRIPKGNNGLFINCTFVGVTFIEAESSCEHQDWNYAGAVEPVDDGAGNYIYQLRFPDLPPPPPDHIDVGGVEVTNTREYSNNIRFEQCTFLGSIAGDTLDEYTHWRNKVQITGETRFYLNSDEVIPADLEDASGNLLTGYLDAMTNAERRELSKSSLLLPGWSVDVGNFTNEQAPDPDNTARIHLRGVIIAGILDVRGTADITGTLLMTFRPEEGGGPLSYGGKPDAFNTTIGYFGPADGDDEGSDPTDPDFPGFGELRLRYDPDALLPDGIPWPVRIAPEPFTYYEGGGS